MSEKVHCVSVANTHQLVINVHPPLGVVTWLDCQERDVQRNRWHVQVMHEGG